MKINIFVKQITQRMYFCVCILLLAHCQSNTERQQSLQTLERTKKGSPIAIEYAQNFKIEVFEAYKVLTLYKPFTDSPDSLQYVFYPKQKPAPKGFEKANFIATPLERVVVLSHTHIAFLQKLGLEDKIVGINESSYLPDIPFKNKLKQGKVKDVSNAQGVINLEEILRLQPEAVIFSSGSKELYTKNQVLAQTGIALLFNGEWLENSPLGRTEWLKMMALLFEEEEKAHTFFETIAEEYQSLKQETRTLTYLPTVFWEVPYKDTWYVPGGQSYVANLLKDAGANYLWKDAPQAGSIALDFETVYAKAQRAKFWISLGSIKNKEELLKQDARFADFSAFQEDNLYNHNRKSDLKGNSLYYFESVVNPHWVLADLIKILHPTLLEKHQWVYFKAVQ